MTWDVVFAPDISGRLCLTLLHSLWQAALFAIAAGVASRVLCQRSVERKYLVHATALVACLISLPITWTVLAQRAPAVATATGDSRMAMRNVEAREPTAPWDSKRLTQVEARDDVAYQEDPPSKTANHITPLPAPHATSAAWRRWAPWLAALYACGVVAMLARLGASALRAERMRRTARPIAAGPAASALQRLATRWSMTLRPALAATEQIAIPTLVGLLKPTILLPTSALIGLAPSELEMILAHELAHLRRRDLWVNVLQRLAEAVLFFNPALWYLSRRISLLREHCCDEWACSASPSAGDAVRLHYATALLRVVELAQRRPAAHHAVATLAASGRSPSELRRRIARLLGEPLREPLAVSRGGLLFAAGLVLATLAAPAWLHSQTPDQAAPTPPAVAYPPPATAADEAVAAARQRTFGLQLVPRLVMKQRITSGQVPGMDKAPEASLEAMLSARGKDFDKDAWSGATHVTLAWTVRQLLFRTESGDDQNKFTQSYLWNGADGWIAETSAQGRRLFRYGSLDHLLESFQQVQGVYLPQLSAAGDRLPWGGGAVTLDEHATAPELTRYKLVGKQKIDGVECDAYEGPQRMERVWIDQATGLVKAVSRSFVHESLPNYYSELVREVAGRTFANDNEYSQWLAKQPADVKERIGAHWSAAHWPTSDLGNLLVFSDYREIAPGVQWPHHCERIVVHSNDNGKDSYKYYRNAIDVTDASQQFDPESAAGDASPREGDFVTDRRFAPDEPEFTYTWKAGDDDGPDSAADAARQSALDAKRKTDEATRNINEAPINSVDDAIKILTDGPKTDPTMIWARAIKYLVDHKAEGLPAAIKQLDGETRDHAISKLAFALRAIGDARAVPALIRALPRTLLPSRNDYGLLLKEDAELLAFMQRHDQTGKVRDKEWFDYGRALREVTSALHRLTDKDFGELELNWMHASESPAQRRQQEVQFHRVATRWARWWESQGKSLANDPAYATVDLPPLDNAQPAYAGRREPPAGAGVRLQEGWSEWIVESIDESKERVFIDLDTMRQGNWPASLPPASELDPDSPQLAAWARDEGFDVVGISYTPPGETAPLFCLHPLDMHVWKITPDEHRALPEAMAGREPYPLARPVERMIPQREIKPPYDHQFGGDAFLFVTREGTAGLLRMTAQVTEANPGGLHSGDDQFQPTGFYRGAKITFAAMTEREGDEPSGEDAEAP